MRGLALVVLLSIIDESTTTDCTFGLWHLWASCSVTCGHGNQLRTRSVTSRSQSLREKHACAVQSVDIRNCTMEDCPIGCDVSEWEPWTECSVTCGRGTMYRKRTLVSSPANSTSVCPPLEQLRSCKLQECEADNLSVMYCRGRMDGNYGYAENPCNEKYYSCVGYVYQRRTCPPGLIFNMVKDRCVFLKDVPECLRASSGRCLSKRRHLLQLCAFGILVAQLLSCARMY
uniref:Chitin-binding type-2 domain-containing protein n=1 Tax=Trichuris muris TaxID=70415 RepID=A0A5S6QL80_TRIMR